MPEAVAMTVRADQLMLLDAVAFPSPFPDRQPDIGTVSSLELIGDDVDIHALGPNIQEIEVMTSRSNKLNIVRLVQA